MAVAVFFIFVLIWYLPLYLKQRKTGFLKGRTIVYTILSGFLPAGIVLVLGTILLSYICIWLGMKKESLAYIIVNNFLCVAMVEEVVKYFTGRIFSKNLTQFKKIDYVLLFGAAGLGYEISESLVAGVTGDVVGSIIRGAFVAHIMWQFFMGAHLFEYKLAKQNGDEKKAKKELILAFAYPILVHGVNDLLVKFFPAEQLSDIDMYKSAGLVIALTLLNLANLIICIVTAYRSLKNDSVCSLAGADNTEPAIE